jgi:outer membrane protein assembly factor BamB
LWPAIVLLIVEWAIITIPAWVAPATPTQFMGWMFGPMIGTATLFIWWLFFSKLRWADRLIHLAVFAVGVAAVLKLSHPSVGGFGLIFNGLPAATTAWVGWLLLTGALSWPARRNGLLIVTALAFSSMLVIRMDGTDGAIHASYSLRWSPTPEDHYLAELAAAKQSAPAPVALPPVPKEAEAGDWTTFRGPNHDGRLTGVKIATDWNTNPPKQIWRHHIGPGWSSFAVIGPRAYTQEQRGEEELVVCYDANTGAELWTHSEKVRFTEVVAGPGPRATPTFYDGKIYAHGAKGVLNCLDAASGKVIWSRDVASESKAKLPPWGFASSPTIVQGIVSVFTGAPEKKSVAAYNAATGEPVWFSGSGQDAHSYCSLQPAKIGGVEQLVVSTNRGLESYDAKSGEVLWNYDWDIKDFARCIQPTIVSDSDVLIGTGFGMGTRRVHVTHDENKWATQQVWMSQAIRPYYNDMVVHKECVYGFDGDYLACVGLADGSRKWQAKGYGNGQVLLLADQDLLLVIGEKGKAALVDANPASYSERAAFQALTGKTWNHPVIAHGRLFVRNGEEAACYQLIEDKR